MRPIRYLTAATALGMLVVGPLVGLAGAGPATGVGTGAVSATAVSVQLGANGDVLSVRLLGDDGTSTIDPAKGTPLSTESLVPLTVSSKTVPALNFTTPSLATSSSGTEDKKSSPDIAVPQTAVFSGKVNALLSSIVDAAGARSGLQAGLANLAVAGGLVHVPTGVVQVASQATGTSASGSRSITIPAVDVLDLSAVLDGLGLSLGDLPINTVLGLLARLGITVPNVTDPAAVVAGLNGAIDTLQGTTGPLTASICSTVDGLLAPLGGVTGLLSGGLAGLTGGTPPPAAGLPPLPVTPSKPGSPVPLPSPGGLVGLRTQAVDTQAAAVSCASLTGTDTDLLNQVRSSLGGLLAGVLATLDGTPLLSVTDVKVGLVATATDKVATSVADVTASIGSVKVGNLAVPKISGLDLTAPAAVINQAAADIQAAVGGVLATINASLANLVKVDVLQITKGVDATGGYTNAHSAVTALRATLDPGGLLGKAALLDQATTPVSSVLGGLGTAVPPLAPLMGQLEGALGGVQALSGPSVVTVGELSGSAAYRATVAAAPGSTPGGTLPRTGRDAALPAMMAVLLGGAALAIRKVLRAATLS
jgi:hypothetical protein